MDFLDVIEEIVPSGHFSNQHTRDPILGLSWPCALTYWDS